MNGYQYSLFPYNLYLNSNDYLLNTTHPDGQDKAFWFLKHGFSLKNITEFKNVLVQQAYQNDINKIEYTNFGTKYIVEGYIETPNNKKRKIRSIWIIKNSEQFPKLVTAFPI